MELLKDFNAFQTLYVELLDEYSRREESREVSDTYIDPSSEVSRFIRDIERVEFIRIPQEIMDMRLEILVKMEKAAYKLPIVKCE